MRVRLALILILFLALSGYFFWHGPYHQVRSIITIVDINAPGDRVWQVLTDLDDYRAWNPFLTSASGAIAPGNRLTIAVKMGKHTISFHPRIRTVEARKKLVWVDRLFSAEILQGEHQFEVIEVDQAHTRVIQSEHFKGILVAVLWKRFSPVLLEGFHAMNDALKRRCEPAAASARGGAPAGVAAACAGGRREAAQCCFPELWA